MYFTNQVEFNAVIHSKSNTSDVRNFLLQNFNKKPQLTQELTYKGLDPEKTEEYKEIRNDYTRNASETSYYFRRKFLHRFKDYNELLESKKKKEKRYFLNQPNATCLPFEVKLFVTATGQIAPCEKMGTELNIQKLTENDIQINYKSITELYKVFQQKSNIKCNSCYYLNCMKCVLSHFNKERQFICYKYVNKETIINKLSKQITNIEKNTISMYQEPKYN